MATALHNLSEYQPDFVPSGEGRLIGLVVSEWNHEITGAMAEAAIETLTNHGVSQGKIVKLYVPGSFELPFGAQALIDRYHPDAVIILGCVIQGETRHFDFICQGVTEGTMQLQLKSKIPVIFGLLTTLTYEQAKDRAGGKHGNKGVEAAVTALKMIPLRADLP